MATINEIEEMNYDYVKENIKVYDECEIKGHQILIVDFEDNRFGYSVLVFKNGKHIYYADDYELHHASMRENHEKLHDYYIDRMYAKLFTDEELCEPIKDYDEYTRKKYFLHNYWCMQYDYVSIFCIGEPDKKLKKAQKNWFLSNVCFCYFPTADIVMKACDLYKAIEEQWQKVKENEDIFRAMVRYELANHEYCITMDYSNTLDALGLRWEKLKDWQRKIFKEEGNRQIEMYA